MDDAMRALDAASPGYEKAEQYADGPIKEVFVSRKIKRILADSGVNFQEVLGNVVVDAVADALKITAVLGDSDPVTQAIAALDKASAMQLVRRQVNQLTTKLGDYYLKAWLRPDGTMQITMVDPRCARVIYSQHDPMTPAYGIHRWVQSGGRTRIDLFYPDRVESYISKETLAARAGRAVKSALGKAITSADFEPYTVEGNSSNKVEHAFGRPPLFHFSTDLPGEYGCPEHKPFYGTQDILLKLSLSHVTNIDFLTLPQRWAILQEGVDTTEAEDVDATQFSFTDDPNQRVRQREGTANVKSEPGSLWLQRGVKSFGQFEPAAASGFIDPAEFHLKIGATTCRTPLHYFDGMGGGLPSGESLKVAMEPLVTKRGERRDTLDHHWRVFYLSILKVLGFPDATVDIRWCPVESTSEAATWSVVGQKQTNGVPQDQTLIEAGYDKETVDDWRKTKESGLRERMVMLGQVGDFLASAATAVAGGSATPEQISAILTALVPVADIGGDDSGDPGAGE
jgi:hypothetical protein